MSPASNTSAQANPLNPGFASVLFSIVLIGLKVLGIISAPWWVVLLPVYFWYALVAGIVGLMFTATLAAVPIIAIALLLGPVIERFFGGKTKRDTSFEDSLSRTFPEGFPAKHDELPEGVDEVGTLADLDGPLFGYVKIPNGKFWWGPGPWTGRKPVAGQHPFTDSVRFAHAPRPTTDSHHEADAHNNDA